MLKGTMLDDHLKIEFICNRLEESAMAFNRQTKLQRGLKLRLYWWDDRSLRWEGLS